MASKDEPGPVVSTADTPNQPAATEEASDPPERPSEPDTPPDMTWEEFLKSLRDEVDNSGLPPDP